jgi:hypothetical protein
MRWAGLFAGHIAFAAWVLMAGDAAAQARCYGNRFNLIDEARIQVRNRVDPGATCEHNFGRQAASAVTVVKRPAQGSIAPASSGRGAYTYRSRPNATGSDSYVIRVELEKHDRRSGALMRKTWAEIEFNVAFTR